MSIKSPINKVSNIHLIFLIANYIIECWPVFKQDPHFANAHSHMLVSCCQNNVYIHVLKYSANIISVSLVLKIKIAYI